MADAPSLLLKLGGVARLFFILPLFATFQARADGTDYVWIELAVPRMKARLQKTSVVGGVNSATYNTGFHCYSFSIEQCVRLGSDYCRSLLLKPAFRMKTGHAMVLLKEVVEVGSEKRIVNCVVEPQGTYVGKETCYVTNLEKGMSEKIWVGPSRELVCSHPTVSDNEDYCKKGKPNVSFRLSLETAEELAASGEYSGWWANAPRIDGQLFENCRKRNRELIGYWWENSEKIPAKTYHLPEAMPSCLEIARDGCSKATYLQACRGRAMAGGEQCLVYSCENKAPRLVSTWKELKLPSCHVEQEAKHAYCKNWRSSQKFEIIRVRGDFDLEHSEHYCRADDQSIHRFRCRKEGSAYFGLQTLYDWKMLGPVWRLGDASP